MKSIGRSAFTNNYLKSIQVDEDNVVYDSRENCNAIIETETDTLIAGCEVTIMPESVTAIEEYAFDGCFGMKEITIPASVTSIGHGAFAATALEKIQVDPKNTVYDSRENCNAIIETASGMLVAGSNNTRIPDGVTSIWDDALGGCRMESIDIPSSVTSIGFGAFQNCDKLKSIIIPNGVTSIGNYAFARCTALTSINIPKKVTSMGENTFEGCTGLTSISWNDTVYGNVNDFLAAWKIENPSD